MKTIVVLTCFVLSLSGTSAAFASQPAQRAASEISITAALNYPSSLAVDLQSSKVARQNATRMAKQYLNFSSFSRSGLIKQLVYEGFSLSVSTKAVDALRINWSKQAVKMAKSYLKSSAFSRQGLLDQLLYEGFSERQALAGVKAVGY